MRLLIIDDDVELSRMLIEYLAGEGFEAVAVYDGEAGLNAASSGGFNAIILDIMLPRMDGIEVLRRIRRFSDVPIVMLSARAGNMDRVMALEMGADDYVPKPYYPLELVARLRAILRRPSGISRQNILDSIEIPKIPGLEICKPRRQVTCDGQLVDLTNSEFNILEALAHSYDNIVTKDDLSIIALGKKREAYDRSLDVHLSNIRRKLVQAGLNSVHIQTVRGIGYCLAPL